MKFAILRVLCGSLMLAVLGCEGMSLDEQQMLSRGLSEEELNAPPNSNEIRGSITTDARTTWSYEDELDRAPASCAEISFRELQTVCVAHEEPVPMMSFTLRSDSPDRPYPVQETAYFCPAHGAYWLHYEGGDQRRNAWLGPRKIKLRKPQGAPYKQE